MQCQVAFQLPLQCNKPSLSVKEITSLSRFGGSTHRCSSHWEKCQGHIAETHELGDSIAAICGNYNLAQEVSFLFSTYLVKKPLRVDAFSFFAVPDHSEVSGGA